MNQSTTSRSLRPTRKHRCIFCGSEELSKEHVLPKWLQKWSGCAEGEHRVSLGTYSKTYDAPPFAQKIKAVCRACNTGWMSRLEGLVSPGLLALVEGKPRTIDTFFQPVLATWAYKTILVQEAAMPEQKLWKNFYADFYRDKLPRAEVQIWMGRYEWEAANYPARYLGKKDRRRSPETGQWLEQGPRLFKGVLTVGAVVLIVCVAYDDATKRPVNAHINFHEHAARLARIWPVSASLAWPPVAGSFSPEQFDALAVAKYPHYRELGSQPTLSPL